jgi:hypothetical protein
MTDKMPLEWLIADDEASQSLAIARTIERRQFPDGNAPPGLLVNLLLAVSLSRAARMVASGDVF